MGKKGFSIVELVVVMLVMGIMAATAFVSLDPYKGIKLNAAVKKVQADLMYVQNYALSTAGWYGVSFEVDPVNTYTVFKTYGTSDEVMSDPSRFGQDFVVDLHDYYSGVTISGVDIGGGHRLIFHPLGTPYNNHEGATPTGEAITSTGVVTVEYGGVFRTLLITPNTGRISIQ